MKACTRHQYWTVAGMLAATAQNGYGIDGEAYDRKLEHAALTIILYTITHMGWALCSTSHGKPLRISQGFPKRLLVSTWWAGEMRAPLGGAGTTHHVYIIERLNSIMMFVLMIYLCVCGLSVLSPTAISLGLRFCLRCTWHLIFNVL